MNEIEKRVIAAKNDGGELEALLRDYLPFIRKQLGNLAGLGLEFDDMMSVAMVIFTNCVKQYEEGRGSFLTFTQISIKNRILDESRKEHRRGAKVVTLDAGGLLADGVSFQNYSKEMERVALADEIDSLSTDLKLFGIDFEELARICPKQERARRLCIRLAHAVVNDDVMKDELLNRKRLALSRLAGDFDISPKTVEKHRKYIVALVLLLMGDYPHIRAFLPQYGG